MRYAIAAAAFLCSTPALATGGFECRPISGPGPIVTMAVAHAIAAPVFQASIRDGKRNLIANRRPGDPLLIAQSWIDRRYLWLDLVDPTGSRFEAKLRANFQPKAKGAQAVGTLLRNGRTYRVRCIEA
jgi:hypothetical protein